MLTRNILEEKYLTRPKHCIFYRNNGNLTISYYSNAKCHALKLASLRNPLEKQLFLSINNSNKIKNILNKLSRGFGQTQEAKLSNLKKIIKKYKHSHPGLFKVEEKPQVKMEVNKKNLRYFKILNTIDSEFKSAGNIKSDYASLHNYHFFKIKDAGKQFDQNELTISHIFRNPHPALRSSTYGARLRQALFKRKPLNKEAKILEIGAGTGWLARRFLDNLKKDDASAYKKIRYFFLDLSPALLKSQRKINSSHFRRTEFLLGNGQRLPFKNNSLDYVIINEVIADFDVVKLDKDNLFKFSNGSEISKAKDAILNYKISIDDAPKKFIFGLGIVKLLEELRRILKPDGIAVITEYGRMWSYPRATKVKGHVEHSVHFGHLKQAAKALGFQFEMSELLGFLRFRKDTKTLDVLSTNLLCKILKKRHLKVPYPVSTKKMLKDRLKQDFSKIKNLRYAKIKENIGGMISQDFKAVILRKVKDKY